MWWRNDRLKPQLQEGYDPRYFGSLIIGVGQPGTGKTYTLFQLACRSAYQNGLPLIAQDPNGDVRKLRDALIAGTKSEAKGRFLRKRVKVTSEEGTDYLEGIMRGLAKDARKGRITGPTAVFFVDESGIMRFNDEDFWTFARRLRNYGVHAYCTQHRAVDIPPVAREVTRAVLLWKPYEKETEFFGVRIAATDCSDPMAKDIAYIDSHDRTVKTFSMDDVPGVLLHPAQPSNVPSLSL